MPDHEYVIPPRLPGESELRVILTDDQVVTTAHRTMRRNRQNLTKRGDEQNRSAAHALFMAERLVPARITLALDHPATDADGFDGDWVDEALGVPVGYVDQWELGVRYPTWLQLEALRELTGKPWLWWFDPVLNPRDTSMAFHLKRGERIMRPIQRFNRRAHYDNRSGGES